jgi:hypothetical protein
MIRFVALCLSAAAIISFPGVSGRGDQDAGVRGIREQDPLIRGNELTPQERRDGFQLLFDGKSLANWHTIPLGDRPGAWRARDGVLSYEPGDSWLASDATYGDFVLRLDYRTGPESDSGIFLRATPAGYPSFTGMEIEIRNDPDGVPSPRSNTALYGAAAPTRNATRGAGEWNSVEIAVAGRRLTAIWNGVTIHDLNLDDPAYAAAARGPLSARARVGHVGFQAHLTGAPVEFRTIRIKAVADQR